MNFKKILYYFMFLGVSLFVLSLNYIIYINLSDKSTMLLSAIGLLNLILFGLLFYTMLTKKSIEPQNKLSDAHTFLANITHELRTPLTGILGFLMLLKESKLDEEQEDFVETIEKSSNNLLSLVNDILDYSKASAGKIELERHSFNMVKTIEESVEGYITKVAEKYIELGLYIDPSLPKTFLGDSAKISQVILNLLSNAIKFTPEHGLVNISIEKVSENDNDVKLKFSVKDSGIGMREDKIEKIFEAFSQAEASTSREFGGTGLGLSISNSFVEVMGGKLEIDTQENSGTTFFFTLTLEKEPSSSVLVEEPCDLSQQNVAYVIPRDDKTYEVIDNNLEAYIRSTKASYRTYYTDEVFNLKELPDTLFINHRYSMEDGLFDKFFALNTNIVLITCANVSKMTTLYEKSVSNFIFKPITYTKTIKALALKEAPVSKAKKLTIDGTVEVLVVDDNLINQKLLERLLLNMKMNVTLADNGLEAFELYKKNNYSIVLMDIQMPVMSGIESTKKILEYEQSEGLRHTPIIAVTANSSRKNMGEYLEAGMDGFLGKPISLNKLKEMITEHTVKKDKVKKSVLLYKAEKLTAKIYTSILEKLDYTVDTCYEKDVFLDKFSNDVYSMVLYDTETFDSVNETTLICDIATTSVVPSFAFTDNSSYKVCSTLLSPELYGKELQITLEHLKKMVDS